MHVFITKSLQEKELHICDFTNNTLNTRKIHFIEMKKSQPFLKAVFC